MEFTEIRKQVIKKFFGQMNERQLSAVTTVNGPLLVLAGAGSGKTTVLVNRIANLVKFGNGYNSEALPVNTAIAEKAAEDYISGRIDYVPDGFFSVDPVRPWNILAITFTNKAAGELKERISAKLTDGGEDVWAGTFHSICGKILRRYAPLVGHTSHFTVYDTDDQRRVMKDILKANELDDKMFPPKSVLSAISHAKDELKSPAELKKEAGNDYRKQTIAELYRVYNERLLNSDAMDFDDMIVKTVELLEGNEDVLDYYSDKFKYIMVDEYQDTNHAQYALVSLLASRHGNLCVVGDDDQSIYRFRGATIENILNFEEEYRNSSVIRLEQNYRSTSNILDAANAVIANNIGRKGKTLWTDSGTGEKIQIYTAPDERSEAVRVAERILENMRMGERFSSNAVLYRMNAQSNAVENVLARSGIPYKVIGGQRFFDRKEIKDALAYLQLINNLNDDLRLKRIINEPRRGIGAATVSAAEKIAAELNCSLIEVMSRADEFAVLSRARNKLKDFCDVIYGLVEASASMSLTELYDEMLEKTGYRAALTIAAEEDEKERDRLDNISELSSTISQYELDEEDASLSGFLEQIALVSDIDSLDGEEDRVVLMTVHSAKGLEFDNVFIVGMEEGIFPGNQSIYSGTEEIEEERRLAYVAITRAKKRLFVSNAYTRMLFGTTSRNAPSRFLREIPDAICDIQGGKLGSKYENTYSYGEYNGGTVGRTVKSYSQPNNYYGNSQSISYKAGQQVQHKTFGRGMIVSATPMGNDTLLEVVFDTVGTKKLMAAYAKLTVI